MLEANFYESGCHSLHGFCLRALQAAGFGDVFNDPSKLEAGCFLSVVLVV